jgi:hypothetical protein
MDKLRKYLYFQYNIVEQCINFVFVFINGVLILPIILALTLHSSEYAHVSISAISLLLLYCMVCLYQVINNKANISAMNFFRASRRNYFTSIAATTIITSLIFSLIANILFFIEMLVYGLSNEKLIVYLGILIRGTTFFNFINLFFLTWIMYIAIGFIAYLVWILGYKVDKWLSFIIFSTGIVICVYLYGENTFLQYLRLRSFAVLDGIFMAIGIIVGLINCVLVKKLDIRD